MSAAPPPEMAASPATDLLRGLLDDLAAESGDLEARVAPLDAEGWRTPTPAEGWDVADTIAHLAATDADARQALVEPDAFMARLQAVASEGTDYVERLVQDARGEQPQTLLGRWRAGRADLATALREVEPGTRVPWFGPAMSPASFVSARVMETWAHGQDVADALGQERTPTDRLRAVAEIGVRARAFSYAVHQRAMPDAPVRVVLQAPSGAAWTWGPDEASAEVTGAAVDFCLLVTQRRHRDDLSLQSRGDAAQEWLAIAQAFAGPPGGGRQPRTTPTTAGDDA